MRKGVPAVLEQKTTIRCKYLSLRGVNGFFSVIGTAVALLLGMVFGFTVVLGLAALCYVIALAVMLPRETPLPVEE